MTPVEARTEDFLQHIETVYSVRQRYHPAAHRKPLEVTTPPAYASSRRKAVHDLIRLNPDCEGETSKSVLSEWTTYFCIASPLSEMGYITEMAAPRLEQGEKGRKGVDLVISKRTYDNAALPLLGINVKLRRTQADRRTDRQKFDSILCAPSISIPLGNWETRPQPEPTQIRGWMTEHLLPSIQEGKPLEVEDLKGYIFGRIARNLESYLWKADHYPVGEYTPSSSEVNLFPTDLSDYESFQNKLTTMHEVFVRGAKQLASYTPYLPMAEYQ